MFEPVKDIINRSKSMNMNYFVSNILNQDFIKYLIISLNTDNQLYNEGIDINSQVVGYYSHTYRAIDGHTKYANNHYDFLDSGEFFRSFKVQVYRTYFVIGANTHKMEDTPQVNEGKDLVGLTETSLGVLSKAILEQLSLSLLKYLNG